MSAEPALGLPTCSRLPSYSIRTSHTASSMTTTAPVTFSHYAGQATARLNDVVAKARLEAAAHRPASNALSMDQNEVELQAEAEKWISSERQLFTSVLTEASRAAHDLQQKLPELDGRIQQLLSDTSLQSEASAEMAGERAALVAATEARMRAEVDLRHFRAVNGITEQAKYPESHLWHFAVIAGLALAETVVNAFFYENAQGLIGGFAVALGVSVVNMGGALALGALFRYKNLRDPVRKAAGWACLPVFLVLTIYCNALFAAFRAEYQLLADPTDPAQVRAAFRNAVDRAAQIFVFGMDFGDLMSFILFGIGLILSMIAFYKGMTFDDRYPGHGDKDRVVKRARAAELESQQKVREQLKSFLNSRRREVQAQTREPSEIIGVAGRQAAQVQQGYATYLTQQSAIQRDFDMLLRAYRDTNTSIRATEPPEYFRSVPNLRSDAEEPAVMQVVSRLGVVVADATAMRDKYQEPLNQKLNQLQRDAATLLDSTFTDFVKRIEQDAEAEINKATITVQRTATTSHVNAL